MRRRGELSTREAARRLEVHERTVRRWASSALYGERSRFGRYDVRKDLVGHYWVDERTVHALAVANDDRGHCGHSEHLVLTT